MFNKNLTTTEKAMVFDISQGAEDKTTTLKEFQISSQLEQDIFNQLRTLQVGQTYTNDCYNGKRIK